MQSQVGYGTALIVIFDVGLMVQHHDMKMVYSGKNYQPIYNCKYKGE